MLNVKIYLVLLLCLAFFSCGVLKFEIQEKSITKEGSGKFRAGAFEIDITPLPGQPMGGFGNDISKIGQGHWTRLYAKTTYVEDEEGNYMIFVICDLWSFPQGLGDFVVELLQSQNSLPLAI